MINLGSKVRDKITGFTGIAIAKSEFLNGCKRVQIQPQELKDGRPIEPASFDEQQVEVVEDTPAEIKKSTGGPYPEPTRNTDPASCAED